MSINWPKVQAVGALALSATVAIVAIGMIVAGLMSAHGCASSVRTNPATAGAMETTQYPDGRTVTKQATATTGSGSGSGDKADMKQQNGPPIAEIDPSGHPRANGGKTKTDLSAESRDALPFYICAGIFVLGSLVFFYIQYVRPGLYALALAVIFAACGWNPLCLYALCVLILVALFHNGMHSGALRSVIDAAGGVTGDIWKTIKARLAAPGSPITFGDHAAIRSAEKAEV